MSKVTEFKQLKNELNDIGERYRTFRPDDAFVYWFIRAYITDDDNAASSAVTGGSGDKSIDGVFIDHKVQIAYLIQAKNREAATAREKREDLINFAQPLTHIEPASFKILSENMHPHVAKLLKDVRKCVVERDYKLKMFYITLGVASTALITESEKMVRKAQRKPSLEVFTSPRVLHIFRDYLDGVAPPIPELDLEFEVHQNIEITGVLQRFDKTNNIESWVVSMKGDTIAELYNFAGVRLFARNIRGFLGGGGAINTGMSSTLSRQPDHFFYYNNGITIVCDRAEHKASKGKKFLTVFNPQIINGQQTTRMLAVNKEDAENASVLVKVMQIPRVEGAKGADRFDEIVSKIVKSTNWQNAIGYSDLVANDRVQIEIERDLRKFDYYYVRKRQNKSEAKAFAGKLFRILNKEELAQAVAGCDLDPAIPREGKNALFDKHYTSIFRSSDAHFYLPRYWAFKHMTASSRKSSQRSWMKWPALHFLWSQLKLHLKTNSACRRFWSLCETKNSYLNELLPVACDLIYDELLSFYNEHKSVDGETIELSYFFRGTKGRHDQFEKHWEWGKTRASKFNRVWGKIVAEIQETD